MTGAALAVTICRLVDLEAGGASTATMLNAVAAIFRATAARWPQDEAAARNFQHLWLDQFLALDRDLVFLACRDRPDEMTPDVVGYLVACRENPAQSARFATLDYFANFADACAGYPAHLHINLDESVRNRGIGRRLVDALCNQLCREAIPGVHIVTSTGARNERFYASAGFKPIATSPWRSGEVVFMARRLAY